MSPSHGRTGSRSGSFPLSLFAGLAASLGCAVIWAVITVVTNREFGIIAVAVGWAVGFAMALPRPNNPAVPAVAAVFAALGSVLGTLFSSVAIIAEQVKRPVLEVAQLVFADSRQLSGVVTESFDWMNLLFLGLAVFAGFRTARQGMAGAAEATATAETTEAPGPVQPASGALPGWSGSAPDAAAPHPSHQPAPAPGSGGWPAAPQQPAQPPYQPTGQPQQTQPGQGGWPTPPQPSRDQSQQW